MCADIDKRVIKRLKDSKLSLFRGVVYNWTFTSVTH